jgi:iron complex outermembrane receptor protein
MSSCYANAMRATSAIALALAFPASHALAQEAAPQPAAEPASISPGDIIVTARKREESLRDVPVAITALSGATLGKLNVTQLIDLSKATPNFTYSYGAANTYAYVRGFGSGSSAGFEQSVGKFVDNVSYGRDQEARIPIFDIERVEVLKGPQVLTFGANREASSPRTDRSATNSPRRRCRRRWALPSRCPRRSACG